MPYVYMYYVFYCFALFFFMLALIVDLIYYSEVQNVMWKFFGFVELSIDRTDIKLGIIFQSSPMSQKLWSSIYRIEFLLGLWLIEAFYFWHIDYNSKTIITVNSNGSQPSLLFAVVNCNKTDIEFKRLLHISCITC